MPSALVNINRRPLFVEISGSGPPFISMHGLGGSTNLFPLAPLLNDHFTVIRFDFEGAGKSPLSDDGLSIGKFVEDCKAILEYGGFAGAKAVIFGHSLGAATGLHFAATYPELVESLVLSCPGLSAVGDPARVANSLAMAATARDKTPYNMADFTAIKNTTPEASLTAKALVRSAMQESTPEGYAKTCEMMAVTPFPDFSKITTKVMIIAGKYDQISSVENGQKIKDLLVAAESTRLEALDVGHQPSLESPEETFALLKSFLQL